MSETIIGAVDLDAALPGDTILFKGVFVRCPHPSVVEVSVDDILLSKHGLNLSLPRRCVAGIERRRLQSGDRAEVIDNPHIHGEVLAIDGQYAWVSLVAGGGRDHGTYMTGQLRRVS